MAQSKGLMFLLKLGVSFRPAVAWLIPRQGHLHLQGVLRQRQQTGVADPGDTWEGGLWRTVSGPHRTLWKLCARCYWERVGIVRMHWKRREPCYVRSPESGGEARP